jgi:hypothetical protein
MSLEERAEERKQYALEQNIAEKAKLVAEVLGKKHNHYLCLPGDGLGGDSTYRENGFKYQDSRLEVKAFANKDEKNNTVISTRSGFFFKRSKEVYSQTEEEVQIFRDEDRWLSRLEQLYAKALATKTQREQEKAAEKQRWHEESLKSRFGLN